MSDEEYDYSEEDNERFHQSQLRQERRVSARQSHKKWLARPGNKETARRIALDWQRENWEKRLYNSAKSRARLKGLEFSIEVSDIEIPSRCPLLGCVLINELETGHHKASASLDRIDSSKGYVKGNVWVISTLANRMKQDATPEQLCAFARGVLDYFQGG